MIVGFTGTRAGMTDQQKEAIKNLFMQWKPTEFHHDDAIGADQQAHDIATIFKIRTIIHPPQNPKYRAFCKGDLIIEEKLYTVRDHDIVNSCVAMIATPRGFHEELRSGTWATIRYSIKVNKRLTIIYPDATLENIHTQSTLF